MTTVIEKDKVLREAYRNYHQLQQYVQATGNHCLTYKGLTISFYDLDKNINKLSPRKKEAFYLNVIIDMKQKDVAERMGITCVSVGQYVAQACSQLAELYFEGEVQDD
jgi:FixJ family two-component response regulator